LDSIFNSIGKGARIRLAARHTQKYATFEPDPDNAGVGSLIPPSLSMILGGFKALFPKKGAKTWSVR
jgi:hypothetical protein